MREIKFRWWDEKTCTMVTGGASLERFFANVPDGGKVMQFTGLKDKNGREIYEGDIVIGEGQNHKYIQVIEFHNSKETCGRGWIGRNIIRKENVILKTPQERIDNTFSYFCWPTTWEVIGNIYENPELL